MTQPWDREDKETGPAWEAFSTYRDLGTERSIAKAVEASGKSAGNTRQWEGWSSKHRWQERVRAWDTHVDQAAQAKLVKSHVERKERQARLGRNLQAVAAIPAQELARRIENGTLDTKDLTVKELMELSARLAAAAKAGSDIENLASDDVTDRTALRVDPHLDRLRALVEANEGEANGHADGD